MDMQLSPDSLSVPEALHVTALHNHMTAVTAVADFLPRDSPPVSSADLLINSMHHMPHSIAAHLERKLAYFHGAMGCPPIASFRQAIANQWVIFPGITVEHVDKYLSPTPFTDKGHMRRIRQGLYSTKPSDTMDYDFGDALSPWDPRDVRPYNLVVKIIPATHRMYMDATGAYRYSDAVNEYDLIFFNEDTNYIHREPLRQLTNAAYGNAFQDGITFFTTRHQLITIHRMDKQHGAQVSAICAKANIIIEEVPPYSHRANKAERAIGTWTNHKISTLAVADINCPYSTIGPIGPQLDSVTPSRTRDISVYHRITHQ
jgi:hypothetical protein